MDKEQSSGKRRSSNRSPPYALFNLLVIIVALIYGAYYQMYLSKDATQSEQVAATDGAGENDPEKIILFTADELKKFDGISECQLVDNLSMISDKVESDIAINFVDFHLSLLFVNLLDYGTSDDTLLSLSLLLSLLFNLCCFFFVLRRQQALFIDTRRNIWRHKRRKGMMSLHKLIESTACLNRVCQYNRTLHLFI